MYVNIYIYIYDLCIRNIELLDTNGIFWELLS